MNEPMQVTRNIPNRNTKGSVGLAATGSHGQWEIAVDEATTGTQKWYAQIEGRSIYLYFGIPGPSIIDHILHFLPRSSDRDGERISSASPESEILIGANKSEPVSLV